MPSNRANRRNPSVVAGRSGPSIAMIIGIVVVVLFAAAVGYGIYHTQNQVTAASAPPANATATGVPIGNPDAPATVDIYLDFQCPVCRAYEATVGPTIDSLIANGSARVIYHPLAFLDDKSDSKYSTRASSAAGCAAADKVFPAFSKLLYANQPPEDGHGLTNAQLIGYGTQAGAGPNFAQCVNSSAHVKWTASLTDKASQEGINGTPTVQVNGKQVDNTDAALRSAVAAAGHK